ncbi:tetratricopeptide repeat protein [uncultured Psychroserpens sp.]|uniref:tetratricopeptide repeat protein n=1 Tax=uncultured Psychroserpens sp. TaxID=255436 RepID=UPI00262A7ABE|nr:tetratricopeptide repeat protein [uncultured Psychroserpens sp.]
MKTYYFLLFLLCFNFTHAQEDTINSYVEEGISHHEDGNYDKAIETYKKALKIEPKSSLVNYEISLTYFYMRDYENAIKHSDIVIKNNDKHLKEAYLTKGSSLDNLGKTQESIKLLKKGIKKFKNEGLMYYNLALNYYRLQDFKNAEDIIAQGIEVKKDHPSSHLVLGYINYNNKKRAQALMNLHYFLFLEPNTARAKEAANLVQTIMKSNVSRDNNKPNTINISLSFPDEDDDFGPAELMISMLEASKSLEENEGKTEDELFIENTDSFFTVLGELKKKKHASIYWDFYVPFFYALAKSEHMAAYCYYVMQSVNPNSETWLDTNSDKLSNFDEWLNQSE